MSKSDEIIQAIAIRELARKIYGPDAIVVDKNAEINPSTEGGSWVAAWVYLSNETMDEHGVP